MCNGPHPWREPALPAAGAGGPAEAPAAAGQPLEVLLLIMRALERQASLRIVVVQVLVRFALDLSAEMAARCPPRWQVVALAAARRAVQSAARQVRTYLQGALSDSFLDVFAEEWDLHCRPLPNVREVCGSVRCLLPAGICGTQSSSSLPGTVPVEWALPPAHSERQHAAKAIRCLLLIRRLHLELPFQEGVAAGPPPPSPATASGAAAAPTVAGSNPGDYPLHATEEACDGYQEGRAFELGRQDRIVCSVVTPEGRHTRYLVLHPFLLLLVQPDLESPGWAVVRALAPVRQVDCQIDRTDPRTLRLGVRVARGEACPGEASGFSNPASADAQGRSIAEEPCSSSSLVMLTLSFEDVKRCHCADLHLRRRRADVRAQLRARAEAFIDGLCS